MDLVFFGIQGSGKGTQAKILAEEFGFEIFEAGGELRKIKESGSELGETLKKYMDNGELVPLEIVAAVVKEAIAARSTDQKLLFDGFPRDEEQMEVFNTVMQETGREFACLEIHISKEEALSRIRSRAEIEGRTDDADEAAVLKRIEIFETKTKPCIEAYKAAGKMVEVEGQGSVEEIYGRIKEGLGLGVGLG